MAYRNILVELVDDPLDEQRVRLALELAGRMDGGVSAAHVTYLPYLPIGYGEGVVYSGPEVVAAQSEAAGIVRDRVHARLAQVAGQEPVPFLALEGERGATLAAAARAFDLTLIPGPGPAGIDAVATTPAEEVAVGAGGPVLVLPAAGWSAPLGERVLIGWNGSREAARALKDALPFLARAATVGVLCLDEKGLPTLTAVQAMLHGHGIDNEPVAAETAGRATGAALLAEARHWHADLLVLGAYGHSRLRELVFGGATRDSLLGAPLPLLMGC